MMAAIEQHEDPYGDALEYDAEGACVQCVSLKQQIDLLRAELAGYQCAACRKPLPVRAFQRVDRCARRTYCDAKCWIKDVNEYAALEREVVP